MERNPEEWRETHGFHATEAIRVNPETWARAIKAADGDRRRIQVLAENSVIIWNSVEQKATAMLRADRKGRRVRNR